jgi:hypothetical protein
VLQRKPSTVECTHPLTAIQAFGAALAYIDGSKTSESGPGGGYRAVSAA